MFTLILLSLVCWVIGLYLFSQKISRTTQNISLTTQKYEALIVLTGGQDRINTAFDLFEKGYAHRLFISGVTSPKALQSRILDNPKINSKADCCITLDEKAETTIGNAIESSKWVKENHISSVLLVTSNYHMPRSLMEFKRQIPTLNVTPYAIDAHNVVLDHWWEKQGTRRLIVMEYNKFLITATKYYLGKFYNEIIAMLPL